MKTGQVVGSEDCLYLNVFVPKTVIKEKKDKVPVMVFIHGGAFLTGSSDPSVLGPDYFMDTEEVILVTLNYRLGPLGALSTEDNIIAGNMGFKDQVLGQLVEQTITTFSLSIATSVDLDPRQHCQLSW